MQSYIEAYRSLDPQLLPAIDDFCSVWLGLIGASMFRAMLNLVPETASSFRQMFDTILRLARLSLGVRYDEIGDGIEECTKLRSVGESYLFGNPDLPKGMAWHTFGDCLSS